ncbi:MAG: hypothetical protein KUG81_04590 [Gammaproteobacteria bacterium]|nr:hypothetical protein [Gammaproteobacteria bacterium]
MDDTRTKGGSRVEINTVAAISNSANKRKMKDCFKRGNVRTARWFTVRGNSICDQSDNGRMIAAADLVFPIVSKQIYGSRGLGNTKIDTLAAFNAFITSKRSSLGNYIFEQFYNYVREYRLHITSDGCFYACRKMMKRDTPDENKWYKNDNNCVWILEQNPAFDKPSNWNTVIRESVKALNSVGLDFGAVDLRIQAADKADPDFIVVEINSAPSFGAVTGLKYKEMLVGLINKKSKQ